MSIQYYSHQYLQNLSKGALRLIARDYGVENYILLKKDELIDAIVEGVQAREAEELARQRERGAHALDATQEEKTKTQEEKDEEYRERYLVKEENGVALYDPFIKRNEMPAEELRAVFADVPLSPLQDINEMHKEVKAALSSLIPIHNEDGSVSTAVAGGSIQDKGKFEVEEDTGGNPRNIKIRGSELYRVIDGESYPDPYYHSVYQEIFYLTDIYEELYAEWSRE